MNNSKSPGISSFYPHWQMIFPIHPRHNQWIRWTSNHSCRGHVSQLWMIAMLMTLNSPAAPWCPCLSLAGTWWITTSAQVASMPLVGPKASTNPLPMPQWCIICGYLNKTMDWEENCKRRTMGYCSKKRGDFDRHKWTFCWEIERRFCPNQMGTSTNNCGYWQLPVLHDDPNWKRAMTCLRSRSTATLAPFVSSYSH